MKDVNKKVTVIIMNEDSLECSWCEREMTEEEHDFCDICDECREENEQ